MGKRIRIVIGCLMALLLLGWVGGKWALKRYLGPPRPASDVLVESDHGIHFGFDGAIQPTGLPAPWESRVIVGKLESEVLSPQPPPSTQKALRIVCDKSHYVIWNSSQPFDPKEYPVLTWSWKPTTMPANGDVRTHKEFLLSATNRNDKALQVMVGFEGDNVLNYAWDANAPVGTEVQEWSPVATVMTRVVDSGVTQLEQWREHRINIYEDYIRRFGEPPTKVLGISISANTNHTQSKGDGVVSVITARKE